MVGELWVLSEVSGLVEGPALGETLMLDEESVLGEASMFEAEALKLGDVLIPSDVLVADVYFVSSASQDTSLQFGLLVIDGNDARISSTSVRIQYETANP